jgi:hypothetical protein
MLFSFIIDKYTKLLILDCYEVAVCGRVVLAALSPKRVSLVP